ncbi:hypothetical protein [Bradyrhizobium liaoningense]|uniref:hypothetical protein n=1 Tax=Bradyrhizobium liaoningense TaxID=43992 RepID=UPI002898D057|nr:hypothetical protein [Bradyrhizobium liaoningense]
MNASSGVVPPRPGPKTWIPRAVADCTAGNGSAIGATVVSGLPQLYPAFNPAKNLSNSRPDRRRPAFTRAWTPDQRPLDGRHPGGAVHAHPAPRSRRAANRDRFVLSKGHATAIMYTLAECGFFSLAEFDNYCRDGSSLTGHVSHAVPASRPRPTRSVTACRSRSAWRSRRARRAVATASSACSATANATRAPTRKASSLRPSQARQSLRIVDFNKIQSFGSVAEVLNLDPFAEKWRAFGWQVEEIDGRDVDALERVLGGVPSPSGRPTVVIAHTVKGKGVSFMENKLEWHYRSPSDELLALALAEVGA